MTELTFNTKKAYAFFSSFGESEDIKVHAKDGRLTAKIAYLTHYLRKSIPIDGIKTEGFLCVSELDKVCKFLKAAKSEDVTFRQLGTQKPLTITAGSTKIELPTSQTISTSTRVRLIDELIEKAEEGKWQMFGPTTLTVTGDINLSELQTIPKLRTVLKSSPTFKVVVDIDDGSLMVTTGKRHEARLFTTLDVKNGTGPAVRQESHYGAYLMEALTLLAPKEASMHFGDSAVFVLSQGDDLLIVVDQVV